MSNVCHAIVTDGFHFITRPLVMVGLKEPRDPDAVSLAAAKELAKKYEVLKVTPENAKDTYQQTALKLDFLPSHL